MQVPGQHLMGDTHGITVGIYKEQNNVRIEYRRRGVIEEWDQGHMPTSDEIENIFTILTAPVTIGA